MSSKQLFSHRRTHHLLLLSRLLNSRDNASPFTLLLDTISQSTKPLVREFVRRANLAKCTVIFVSFETSQLPWKPSSTMGHKFIPARSKSLAQLQKEITSSLPASGRSLIIIDTLHKLCSFHCSQLSGFLSSLLNPATSLIATYHLDIPFTASPTSFSGYPDTAPHPLTLLQYLSTTLITVHSINHILLQKQHRDKSLLVPKWGLLEEHPGGRGRGIEGAVVGIGSNSYNGGGIVLEIKHRRKSGRGVQEWFFLPLDTPTSLSSGAGTRFPPAGIASPPYISATPIFEKVGAPPGSIEKLILLEDHPAEAFGAGQQERWRKRRGRG